MFFTRERLVILSLVAQVLLGTGAATVSSCWNGKESGPSTWEERSLQMKSIEQEMASSSEEVRKHSGEGRCKTDSQCRVVGLGARVCDGFHHFLIYSVQDTDEESLLGAVARFNRASAHYNDLSLSVPNCGKRPREIRCIREFCTAVK